LQDELECQDAPNNAATVSGSLRPLTVVLTLNLAGRGAKDFHVSPVELETAYICVVEAMQRRIGARAQAWRNGITAPKPDAFLVILFLIFLRGLSAKCSLQTTQIEADVRIYSDMYVDMIRDCLAY